MGVNKAKLFKLVEGSDSSGLVVIFVHGLSGDPISTWKMKGPIPTLAELLGEETALAGISLYSFGYKSGLFTKQYNFNSIAEILHTEIQARLSGRDILFVAHSMGGLAVQQYLVNRLESSDKTDVKRIKGIIYLAVPFRGSGWVDLIPNWVVNRQLQSLGTKSQSLLDLEASWNKQFPINSEVSVLHAHHLIPQIAIRGERDHAVAKNSTSILHSYAKVLTVDENHTSICKVDSDNAVYLTIRNQLCELTIRQAKDPGAMVLHVHGYEKEQHSEPASISVDWTKYFDPNTSPRKLPTEHEWLKISNDVHQISTEWTTYWSKYSKLIRIYAKLSLPGGVFLGNRFSRTRNVVLEVMQGGQFWSSDRSISHYEIHAEEHEPGTNPQSHLGILILSVSNHIMEPVQHYLHRTNISYRTLVNLIPPSGVGHQSISNAEEAVAYASAVKNTADSLKSKGIQEIYLFLNCPFAVSVFVGHYLTALSPIQVFDFIHPGYTMAIRI